MNNIRNTLKKYALKPVRYTIKQNAYIITTDSGRFVLKKINRNRDRNNIEETKEIYNYLQTRSFEYFPKLLNADDEVEMYEYIEDVNTPEEQKAIDLVSMMSLLHNKTTYYKEVPIDTFKEKYEDIKKQLDELTNYYDNLITIIETKKFMSPSEYHLARNISIVFSSINFCKYYLEEWYTLINKKTKIRLVTVHNNLRTDHILENKNPYLISWNKANIDIPIYDFYNLYKYHYLDFDFEELYNIYCSKYPLLKEEKMLLFILLAIPPKVELNNNELKNCIAINKALEYIYRTEKLIKPDTFKQTSKETAQ